jgi:hypothetical protein
MCAAAWEISGAEVPVLFYMQSFASQRFVQKPWCFIELVPIYILFVTFSPNAERGTSSSQ